MRIVLVLLSIFLFSCKTVKPKDCKDYSQSESVQQARKVQLESRISDKAVKNIDELEYFNGNSTLRIKTNFTKNEDPSTFDITTSSGKKKEFYTYGYADFYIDGHKQRLSILRNTASMRHPKYKNYLFLPFTDLTNGEETYGGGRYIDITIDDIKDNLLEIDFNTAYNPYCAYGDGWNCPIPPAENDIPIKIMAGEKAFKGTKQNRQ